MKHASIGNSYAPTDPSWYTQEANPVSQTCDSDIEPVDTEPWPRAEFANPENRFAAVGAQFEDNLRNTEPEEEMLMLPTSTIGGPCNYQSAEPITLRHSEIESPNPAYKGPDTFTVPEVKDHHRCRDKPTSLLWGPPVTSGIDDHLRDAMVSTAQSQVEDLRETVGILNREWLQRCQSISDVFLRASRLSPQSLLDEGAQALQLVFRDHLPTTFDAIFALAHFTCAAAYTVYGNDSSHRWDEFFQHILDLKSLIRSEGDARLFVQLINLLLRPPCSIQRSCGDDLLDEGSGTPVRLQRCVFGLGELSLTDVIDPHAPRYARNPSPTTFLHSLKSSAVFQECLRFLDGKLIINICSTSHNLSM